MTQDGDTRTSFSDDRLAVENSVEGEAIFILITAALKKSTEPGLALEPGCEHSWVSDSIVRRQCGSELLFANRGNRRRVESLWQCRRHCTDYHTLHDI